MRREISDKCGSTLHESYAVRDWLGKTVIPEQMCCEH
jgi:hypothetical protein